MFFKGVIMIEEAVEILSNIDKKITILNEYEIQKEFDLIPLELFGTIQIDRPHQFPNLMKWLPLMAPDDVQIAWTGTSGTSLLRQSVAFIRSVVSNYHAITCKPLRQSKILDFGCGWGRLIRLMYKYVPTSNIYAVDPWDQSIEHCKRASLLGNFYISDYLPRNLPTPDKIKFDLIFAFSVFTHLSEKATLISLNTLTNYLTDDGVLVITIRPIEYWQKHLANNPDLRQEDVTDLIQEHHSRGIAFFPHKVEKIEGEVTYGDTSLSLSYIEKNCSGLKIVGIELSEIDPLQIIVFLQKK